MSEDAVVIWHNPRCGKSRSTLKLLQERGIAPRVVYYIENPPSVAELTQALELLGLEPRDLMREGESPYEDLDLADASKTDDELIAAMAAHSILIQRPIVFANGKAALGRPPEDVLAIL